MVVIDANLVKVENLVENEHGNIVTVLLNLIVIIFMIVYRIIVIVNFVIEILVF